MIKKISIIGLGYVGSSLAAAIALSNKNQNKIIYCIENSNSYGKSIIKKFNKGKFPFESADKNLVIKFKRAIKKNNNFKAFTDLNKIKESDIVVISVGFEINHKRFEKNLKNILFLIKKVSYLINPECLIFLQTTLPPGTTEHKIIPLIKKIFKKRQINKNPNIAYSYERAMPGKDYLNSVSNFWRVYSSSNSYAGNLCKKFLKTFINTNKFPLTKLKDITSCETAKVLENTYRAVNIALVDEWTKFSQKLNLNLYDIIEAIRVRPTHNNLRYPGLGVGGYCLTKDPTFVEVSAKSIFRFKDLKFPMSNLAININSKMPSFSFNWINKITKNFKNKKTLLFGLSYKNDVGDLRFSPSVKLAKYLIKNKFKLNFFDPYVLQKELKTVKKISKYDSIVNYKIFIFSVNHSTFIKKKIIKKIPKNSLLIDLVNFFEKPKYILEFKKKNITYRALGK